MLVAVVAVVFGVVLLAYAADQFVLGAARVALIKNVPSLVVGVVVVGFGTSAPEMLVSSLATVGGEPAVAIGNVVGSNIANLSLLLGIGALVVPLSVDSRTVKREAVLVIVAVVAFAAAVQGGGISRPEGFGLLAAMALVLFVIIRRSTSDPMAADVIDLADAEHHRLPVEAVRTVLGLVGTLGAAQVLLWGALRVADEAGLSQGFVGTTLVAVGTSLPELVTVVQSARRNETDLIVGNLLGSNLFNALAVGGLIGILGQIEIDDAALTTVAATAAIVVAVAAMLAMRTNHTISKAEGAALVVAYLALVPFLA